MYLCDYSDVVVWGQGQEVMWRKSRTTRMSGFSPEAMEGSLSQECPGDLGKREDEVPPLPEDPVIS